MNPNGGAKKVGTPPAVPKAAPPPAAGGKSSPSLQQATSKPGLTTEKSQGTLRAVTKGLGFVALPVSFFAALSGFFTAHPT